MKRAKKAGYTAVVVTDTKFARLADRNGDRPPSYFSNLRRTAQAADELGLEIIPMVGSFGYSNDILQNDPNLAEGLAVRRLPSHRAQRQRRLIRGRQSAARRRI